MKRSIKQQLSFVFIGLTVCILLACFAVNGFFLEKYYIANKKEALLSMYEDLNECLEEETLSDEDIQNELLGAVEKGNISFVIQNNSSEVILATNNDKEWLQYQLFSYQFNKNTTKSSLLNTGDDYEMWRASDPRTGMEYIEMWGYFPSGEAFLIRTPMESIRESAVLANKFLIYVGSTLLLLSILFVRYFAKRITNPILELAKISTRMANLDFDAKYVDVRNDEIGVLGASFNAMSYKLEQTISELKKVNNELLQDIESKEKMDTMRAEFLSNVSHELKTPIALIQGYAEGLKEGISEDKDSRDFYCEVIMDEADKMNQLVKNLLELNHLEYNNQDLEIERFDIIEMLRGILQSLDIMIQQKECKVLLDFADVVYVWGDQFKVEHVLRNYLTNALNHVQGDNVIQVKIVEDERAKITVFNTGNPIPEQDIDRIWEKFYKVDKARTREYGGSGIGLSVVKAIMESLHQEFGVRNYNNGVEFWFELEIK
ncbi:MAG: HAMP domain-containing sensor histidine kinase [Eubacteriales bacterium]